MSDNLKPVLIVGAGPTGMMAAIELSRFNIPVRLIERKAEPETSPRAIGVHARTLELLEQRGLGSSLVKLGNPGVTFSLYGDGKRIWPLDFERISSKYNYLLFVSQAETENVLREALDKAGVTIERNLTFLALGQADHDTKLAAILQHTNGSLEQFECSYLIDAEGAHSTARGTVGLHFEGKSHVEDYALGDLHIDGDLVETDFHSKLKDKLAQGTLYLEEEIRSEMDFEQIVGQSPELRKVLELVETVAQTDSTVLLLGETGTGKELIARAIHDHSRRKTRTFVKLNCAAIPTGLLESELFGHEKGAFTGAITQKVGRMELADQGTLFLDEVGDIPIEIQPKLLRALQEREFERLGSTHTRKANLRLVAATNRDLEQMIANQQFRSDLYYRLHVFPIRIPPLRERREDIRLLVSHFVQKYSRQMQKDIDSVPCAALKTLSSWHWPGNIRELENFIERAVILTRGKSLEAPLGELKAPAASSPPVARQGCVDREDVARIVRETMEGLSKATPKRDREEEYETQRSEIMRVLRETNGRVGGTDGAAARMGINRTTLISRIKRLGIHANEFE